MVQSKLQRWLINYLRRARYRVTKRVFGYSVTTKVKERARIDRGLYQCEKCMAKLRNGEFQIDHTAPVISPTRGFVSFDVYIERLFVDYTKLKLLCIPCHQTKTQRENKRRRK